ncbi:hypothetical protein BJ741DRAFT_629714 [Chytriomyces cf. hyalinus JEL632]|nr:hypothetical protein BJ741DRAFT_629714 [Chytriomyces cf. hyalinus JEL632]
MKRLLNQVRRFIHTAPSPMTQLSRFAESLSVDGANFETLHISTSGNGSTTTEVLRGEGTHANFSIMAGKDTTASTHAPKVTFDQDQHRTVRLHIHYPDDNADVSSLSFLTSIFSSYLSKDSPPVQVVQNATVKITLPYELENVGVEGNVGSCKWDAGNVKNSFKVALTMGIIEAVSPLTCANASLKVNTGTIHVAELTANTVELKATTGEIKGLFRGYKSMDAEIVVGSLDLTLHPSSPVSDTSLRCESGSIAAKVFGFQGKFNVEADWGGLGVSGHIGNGPFKSLGVGKFSGWVAKKNIAGGSFGSHAGLGATKLEFHS